MKIDHIKLPPVSEKFYDRLVLAFPPIDPLDISKDTNMIDIQRNAAQQQVLQYIKRAVVKDLTEDNPMSFWDKFKYVFK